MFWRGMTWIWERKLRRLTLQVQAGAWVWNPSVSVVFQRYSCCLVDSVLTPRNRNQPKKPQQRQGQGQGQYDLLLLRASQDDYSQQRNAKNYKELENVKNCTAVKKCNTRNQPKMLPTRRNLNSIGFSSPMVSFKLENKYVPALPR